MASGFSWHVTGLWHPDDTVLADMNYYGAISDPDQGQVVIPLNDSRRAQVTVSLRDPIIQTGDALWDAANSRWRTYARFLKVYYHDLLVFWGPIKLVHADFGAETAQISAVDISLKLINHVAVRGDLDSGDTYSVALSADNDDHGWITIDEAGLRLLRDAALNTAAQTTRNMPDLGVVDGTNDFGDPVGYMGISRWDQIWNTMIQLSQSGGPDFELEPIEDTVGAYAQLNTYASQGEDRSAETVFHYGTGKQNLDNLSLTDGAVYITHNHVVTRDGRQRVTTANLDSSGETGAYVRADAVDFDAQGADPDRVSDALAEHGVGIVNAYGRPLVTCQLTLPPETDDSYRYGTDYAVGDVVGVAGRVGVLNLEPSAYRITEVRLNQTGPDNGVQPEIDVIPGRVAALSDELTTAEE